ncbi:MAG TPA: hypothetical protein VFJ12_09030 [Segeticoccus sp.]|jgi:hypothetical protein|nr:hypothetical protein [Segeticoccus sp.]
MSEPADANLPVPGLTRLLTSRPFARSRRAAETLVTDRQRLLQLVEQVARKDFPHAPAVPHGPEVGPAVALVLARADAIDDPDAPEPTALEAAHLRLVVAALHYLVTVDDVIPDDRPGGRVDDAAILRWVFGAAAEELGPYLRP